MAFFGFFRKKQEEQPTPETFDVGLGELSEWFDRAMNEEIRKKRLESEGIYNTLLERFSEVKQSLDKLDRARMLGAERVHIAANMIKESFVKKTYHTLNSLTAFNQQNFRPDYEYFLAYQDKSMEAIKELKNTTPKQAILLSRYFKRESENLVDCIKKAEELSLNFKEFLKTGSGALGIKERIRNMVREGSEIMRDIERIDLRTKDLEEELKHKKEKKAELEKRFLDLLKSRDWNELNRLSKEIVNVRERLREAESRIDAELSTVRRPLKKLEHSLARAGISPIQKNTLQDFIRNPLRAILPDKGEKDLQIVLRALKKQIDKGRIEVKDKDQVKVDDLIEKLERDIPELKFKYKELREVVERIEKQLESLSTLEKSKEVIEAEIQKISEETGRLQEELTGLKSRRSGTREQLSEKIRDLETIIFEETQKKVTIKV